MATGPVAQILFRTPICAVNSDNHLRVYTQDVFGNIRESLFEGGWANGTIKNVVAQAKIGSPMAATSKALNEIRVYYISNDNMLREVAYSASRGWYNGDLNAKNFEVAPYSKIAATFLPGSSSVLRIYAQNPDDTIQEYGYDSASSGWQKMTNLGGALPGCELTATSFQTSQLGIRVYLQDTSLKLLEKAYDANKGWYTGTFSIPDAAPRATLSCTSFNASSSGVSLRIYYSTESNTILERAWDGSWYDGGFEQPCIPGSESSVITWGSGSSLQLRVYFQNGTKVTGVSEWCFSSGAWVQGVSAIPPA